MKTNEVIKAASVHLHELPGHIFDVVDVTKPESPEAAVNLAKVVSKLSPMVGNMIEFNTCEFLNEKDEFKPLGKWRRQDPGFPDVIFDGEIKPTPGFEIKAWFPLATEITARFKDSQNHFLDDKTYVAMIAWLPEYLIFGRPKIIGVVIASGASVAAARDSHYHRPPDYLVMEPEDTKKRTRNLQQTNTNGYKWQSSEDPAIEANRVAEAKAILSSWGEDASTYCASPAYQEKLRELLGKFKYRLDTNFAKLDRIGHEDIEGFADKIYAQEFHGMTVGEWNSLLSSGTEEAIKEALAEHLDIKNIDDIGVLLK